MTMWLLVLLAIVVVGALMWRTERRRRATHPGSRVADGPRGGESSGPFVLEGSQGH